MNIENLGNIPFRTSVLQDLYPDITKLSWKARQLEDAGKIMRLKRGLYVNKTGCINEFLIANHLHGPSYISMQTALRYYGLIPESVYQFISVTISAAKKYHTPLGLFSYVHCTSEYYPVGIQNLSDGDNSFLIATPEKALCDLVCFTPNLNLRYRKEIHDWLLNDLRFDMEALLRFDTSIMERCASVGKKSQMITQIINYIDHERNV